MAGLRAVLPLGQAIDDEQFEFRHRLICWVLLAHVPALIIIGVLNGYALWHTVLESSPSLVLGLLGFTRWTRIVRSFAGALGLIWAAATLVHFTNGMIEAHFHWFVVLAFAALYVDVRPFVGAVLFTAVHHAVMSLYDSTLVFEHQRGQDNPFLWTGVHVVFVVMLIGALSVNWFTLTLQHERWIKLEAEQQEVVKQQIAASDEAKAMAAQQKEMLLAQQAQAEALAERTATLVESSSDVRELIGGTSSTMDAINSAASEVADGVHSVLEMAVRANGEASSTRDTVQQLSEQSRRITEMVDLISDIAEQTNLLALNASIESARAGDAGKGFAVVANEVKGLAKRTSEATDQIREITQSVREQVDVSTNRVSGVANLVDQIVARQGEIEAEVDAQQERVGNAKRDVETASNTMLEVIQGIDTLDQTASNV
jgi:methyl-accepting chemotaxis protein